MSSVPRSCTKIIGRIFAVKIVSQCLAASTGGSRLHTLTLADLNGRFVVDRRSAHSFLDLTSHRQESLLDIGSILGRGLEERNSQAVGKFLSYVSDGEFPIATSPPYLCHGVFNHLLVRHITLVTDQQLIDTFRSVAIDFLEPLLDIVEGVHICHIVHDTNTMSTSVVGRRDGSESFLASGIPLTDCQKSDHMWE